MPKVKCSVANCEYWAQGNNCSADTIAIEIDQHATSLDSEFAGEGFGVGHQDHANKAAATCCHTFEQKKAK